MPGKDSLLKSLKRIRGHERSLRVQVEAAQPRRKAALDSQLAFVRERIAELERQLARQEAEAGGR